MSNRLYQVCTTRPAVIVLILALTVNESSGISYYTDDYNKVDSATLHEPNDLLHPSRNSTMSVVSGAAGDVFHGSAAIIAEDWIVTAKHVVAPIINDPTLGFKVAGAGSTYKPDIENNVPMIFMHENETVDIALVRVVTANGQEANFSNWIPIATPPPITTVTIGGYGLYFPEGNPGTEDGSLHWGRNVATTDHNSGRLFASSNSPSDPDYVNYEGNVQSGDSGGGWFFRDGWDWRIAAESSSGLPLSVARDIFTDPLIQWLDANMGTEFPSPPSPTSVPTPNRIWNGSGGNWSMSSSWTGGLPDGLSIAKVYSSVAISSSTDVATVGDLYVMSQSGSNGSISQGGGELKATWDIFMAPESDDAVTYYLSGGTVSAEQMHVGYRGQGTVIQSGGGVVAKSGVLVGTDNDGALYPSYYLMSAGSLTTQGLQLGVKPGAEGNFWMSSTGTATVTSNLVQIGYRGTGAFVQSKGTVSASHVELGGETGSSGSYQLSGTGSLLTVGSSTIVGRNGTASFVQSGGIHTTPELAINSISTYTLSGGQLGVSGLSNAGVLQLTGGEVDTFIYNQSGNESALIMDLAADPISNVTLSVDALADLQGGKLQLNIDESLIENLTIGVTVFSIIDAPNVQGEFHEVVYGDATFQDFLAQDRALAVKYVNEEFDGSGVRSSEGVEVHIAIPGDFNLNGQVDLDDLIVLSENFNESGGYSWSQGDIDGDGDVDLDDLITFSVYYNQGGGGGSSSIPEPTPLALTALALLALTARSRRSQLSRIVATFWQTVCYHGTKARRRSPLSTMHRRHSNLFACLTGCAVLCSGIPARALTSSQGPMGANLDLARSIGIGAGVTVGILDTVPLGVAPYHQLGDRLMTQVDFRNLAVGDEPVPILVGEDLHETLAADVIGGGDGVYRGTAPGVNVYLAGVSGDYASFQAGTEWLVNDANAKLVNLSAGWGNNGNGNSQRERFADWTMHSYDMLLVEAAGNSGGQIKDPGGFFNGITVGSFHEATQGRYQYSSYLLTGTGEARGKPEILAPGVSITDGVSVTFPLNGTSFAAPHVAGTAALLMELGEEQLGAPLGHLATKALILNGARKRGVNEPQAGLAQSFDYSANHASNDRDYLGADGSTYATGPTTLTKAWAPTSWTHDGTTFSATRPLDDEQGVGLLDTSRSVLNLLGGRQSPGDVSGIGWDFGTLSLSAMASYTLDQAIPAGNFLTATVVWDRIVSEADGNGIIELDDEYVFQELANLDLRLRDGMGTVVAQSISNTDNLQHLHVPITATGTPGDYSLEVVYSGGGVLPTDYALAWWVGTDGLAPGDYNYDGVVDMGDYDSWRGSFAQAAMSRNGLAEGDGNGDGTIDISDYVLWRDRAGSTFESAGSGTAVPEPTPLALATLALLALLGYARRR